MNKIELLDKKRRQYSKFYFMGLTVFTIAWIPRLILKSLDVKFALADRILILVLALSLPFQVYGSWGLARIARLIKKDPELKAALYNEYYLWNDLKAWKTGFFTMGACLAIFAVASLFIPFDVMAVALTAIWTGVGGYHISLYRLERSENG